MQQKHLWELGRQWKTQLYIAIFFSITFSTTFFSEVRAQGQLVTVRILIEQAHWNGCSDTLDPPDIYFNVTIDGVNSSTINNSIEANISPFDVNLEIVQEVNVLKRTIPISIKQWDYDDTSPDDKCDFGPLVGDSLNLNLDLANCQISGDVSGVCGTSIIISNSDPIRHFVFKISIEEPPHEAGLSLRCLHDPIWPQPGDPVTITAEALDGSGNPMMGIVDDIEIWIDNTTTPVVTTATTPGSFGVNLFTFNPTPAAAADQILYRCRVRETGQWVSSGWRIVQIGQPARGRAVPILYTGVPNSRVDIVFIADGNDYTGPNDPQFLTDVHTVIRDAYYAADPAFRNGGRLFLFNQETINYWVALDTGVAVDYCPNCPHQVPFNWYIDYGFAETGAIVHRTNLRDHATPNLRVFSAMPTAVQTFLHETGHFPFGLADEYCCDGGYFQADPYPNIYSDQGDCQNDPLATVSDTCQQIGDNVNWYRLDPLSTYGNDLMVCSGDHTARPADEQRINWYFSLCRQGGC